jgi:hypothetical protein
LPFFVGGRLLALASPGAYETRINGEFHGWDGDTVYELTDGTVIKESNYHYHYHYAYDPEVILYDCNGFTCKIHAKRLTFESLAETRERTLVKRQVNLSPPQKVTSKN